MTNAYEKLGASAGKEEVHRAIRNMKPALFPNAFCRVEPDVLGGDPDWCSASHADGAGTKSVVAYLAFRETGDPSIFAGIAQDALVMNLDDLLCIGVTGPFLLSNTIGRNKFLVPGDVIEAILAGYRAFSDLLSQYGIEIHLAGGETADVGDVVRTVLVDATMTARLRRDQVIDNSRIAPGDLIVGLSSTGKAVYEPEENSGIASNGLTLARHVLLSRDYATRYPETLAPELDPAAAYRGPFRLHDRLESLNRTVGEALLCPTRTYAPVLRAIFSSVDRAQIHGLVHNTGGGQTKCRRFGSGIAYVKDNLFPVPPLFELIQQTGRIDWREMFQTFNMGHRLELFVPEQTVDAISAISQEFGIEAKIVGRCERAVENRVEIVTPIFEGTFP